MLLITEYSKRNERTAYPRTVLAVLLVRNSASTVAEKEKGCAPVDQPLVGVG